MKQNKKLKLIDVTFREGANLNNWLIKKENVLDIVKKYSNVNIDYIEIGYINKTGHSFLNYYDKGYIKNMIQVTQKNNLKLSAMANLDQFNIKQFTTKELKQFGLIRLAFNKKDLDTAKEIIPILKNKGIKISINLTRIYNYSLNECIKFANIFNNLGIDILYIADTEGKLLPNEVKLYINTLSKHFKKEIGYHAHDHIGLAMSNSIIAINEGATYIDFSLFGFGKGMANLSTEKFLSYLAKQNNNLKYIKGLNELIKKFIPLISTNLYYSKILEKKFIYTLFGLLGITLSNDKKLKLFTKKYGLNYYDTAINLIYKYNGNINKLIKQSSLDNDREKSINNNFGKIKSILNFIYNNSKYYKKIIGNKDITNYNSFTKLPFLDKHIYREKTIPLNGELFSSTPSSAFLFSSGGTTTKPRYIYRDFTDIDDQFEYFQGLQLSENDTIINLFMPGIWGVFTTSNIALSYYKSNIIPLGGDNLDEKKLNNLVQIINNFNVNCLIGVPSTILRITKFLEKHPKQLLKINKIYCLGEKIYPSIKKYLNNMYNNLNCISIYGCMESAGIGYQDNIIHGDYYRIFNYQFIEIIDPFSGKILNYGEEGEIIVTNLKNRLVPIIRFKTGDIGTLLYDKNLGIEILKIRGRSEDLVISATVHIELKFIDTIIEKNKLGIHYFQIHIINKKGLDFITLKLETTNNKDNIKKIILNEIGDLDEALQSKKIGGFYIELHKDQSLSRNYLNGKLKRIFDYRK